VKGRGLQRDGERITFRYFALEGSLRELQLHKVASLL